MITVERYKNVIQKKIDEWIYIFKNNEVAEGSTSKNIDQAELKLAEINMDEAERKRYEKFLINLARDRDVVNTAILEGEKKGIEKGKQQGIVEGEKIGIEKGKQQTSEKIARQMKAENEPIEKIIKFTGLTKEQIEGLT